VTNEELQMLKDVLSTVGSVSTQGFDAMVRYTFASGLTWLIVGAGLFLLALVGLLTGFLKDFDDGDFNGACIVGGGFLAFFSLLVIGFNLVDVIEPAGATVAHLLDKATT
jgi:hypothetical protein